MNGWAVFAQAAMDWTGGYLKARTQQGISNAQGIIDDANTYAQNLVNNANADAANTVRKANNQLAVAQANLGNAQRSIANQQKLIVEGKQLDAQSQNLARIQDQMARGDLETSLRAAEQLGALHAAAASNGVGGASASMLHNTLALSVARQKQAQSDNAQYTTYDAYQQRMGITQNTIASLDQGQSFAAIDYSTNVAPLVQSPLRIDAFLGSATSQAWQYMLSKDSGNIAQSISSWSSSGDNSYGKVDLSNSSRTMYGSDSELGSGTYDLGSNDNSYFGFQTSSSGSSSGWQLQ